MTKMMSNLRRWGRASLGSSPPMPTRATILGGTGATITSAGLVTSERNDETPPRGAGRRGVVMAG